MAFATTQQLNKYYDLYKDIDVTFSKEVIQTLGFVPKQVFIRTQGGQWPCIINSASMMQAKVICGKNSGIAEKLLSNQISGTINIRFAFSDRDAKDTVAFFVAAKLIGASNYDSGNHDLLLLNFEYTQRAPDDLIEKLGSLLEANINSKKRKNERIQLTDENLRKISLAKKETFILVDGIPRRCILCDISFSGAKFFIAGVANFLINKLITLKIDFDEPQASYGIKGKTIRAETVEGRKDLVALIVDFDPDSVPMGYKMQLNRYFMQTRKQSSQDEETSDVPEFDGMYES